MSIFKKKQRSIYESQPRIDFNDSPTAPIVHSDQPLDQLTKPVLAPETPFQKVNFERESEVQHSSEVSSNTSVLTKLVLLLIVIIMLPKWLIYY